MRDVLDAAVELFDAFGNARPVEDLERNADPRLAVCLSSPCQTPSRSIAISTFETTLLGLSRAHLDANVETASLLTLYDLSMSICHR
jgi:hypothetical protein